MLAGGLLGYGMGGGFGGFGLGKTTKIVVTFFNKIFLFQGGGFGYGGGWGGGRGGFYNNENITNETSEINNTTVNNYYGEQPEEIPGGVPQEEGDGGGYEDHGYDEGDVYEDHGYDEGGGEGFFDDGGFEDGGGDFDVGDFGDF